MKTRAELAIEKLQEVYVNANPSVEVAFEFIEQGGQVDDVEDFREFLKDESYWLEWWDNKDKEFHVQRHKLPLLMEEHHCNSEAELVEVFEHYHQTVLVVEDDFQESFPITTVSRADLRHKGFDTDRISNAQMEELASRMSDDYQEQLFWQHMEQIADEIMHLPKLSKKQRGEEERREF